MKNVTIALDDETHRNARIRAAELGTSLSALVKDYLTTLASGDAPIADGVREMGMQFPHAAPSDPGPWLIDGKLSYTRDGKPRQPGAFRSKFMHVSLKDLETPDWLIDIMENGEDDFSDLMPFDVSQLPK